MSDVVTLGECMVVLYPPDPVSLDEARTLLIDIGGAEANLAIALCLLVTARVSSVGSAMTRLGGGCALFYPPRESIHPRF